MFSRAAIVLGTTISVLVNADGQFQLPEECLVRGDFFGSDTVQDLESFDYSSTAVAALPVHFTPYEFSLCVDLANNNKLLNFSIIFANADASDRFVLPTIGKPGGTCATVEAPDREFPRSIVVYQDGSGINAVTFVSRGDLP